MNKQIYLLTAEMLDLAADTFSNHGCNDLSQDVIDLVTDEETLCNDIRERNGDLESDWPRNISNIGDSSLMIYLSHKMEEAAEGYEKTKKDFIALVKKADPSEECWNEGLIESLPNCYAKGYLSAKESEWNNNHYFDEMYQEELLSWCEGDIWK